MEARQCGWMALWQQRSSRGALGTLLVAGLSGIAVGLFTGLWIHFGARRRRREATGAQRLTAVEAGAPARSDARGDADDPAPAELQAEFAGAAAWVGVAGALANSEKLALYGCYKQALSGDCPAQRPWGMEASMKWAAWQEHRGASRAEAMRRYVAALDRAAPSWRAGPEAPRGPGPREGTGPSTGPAVSLLGCIGDPSQAGEDATPVGQLCERIAQGEAGEARAILGRAPALAFQADRDGMTPLHWACDRGSAELVRALLEMLGQRSDAPACLNARDASGDTPLHFAVLTDNMEIARLLLGCRAALDAKNNEGESPLALADGEEWRELLGRAA